MPRFLVTVTKQRMVFRKITKNNRPLTILYERLYRIDDDLFYSDRASENSLVAYDLDEQQPYGDGQYLDPEFTKILIDSMKMGKGKINRLFDINWETITAILVVGVIAWAIISQYLEGGF